jgi:hypothetical protein
MYYTIITIFLILILLLQNKYLLKPIKGYSKKTIKETFQDDNNLKIKNIKNVNITLNLVYLDPKYKLDKVELKDGKLQKIDNLNWDKDYMNTICYEDNNKKEFGCSCIKLNDVQSVCGFEKNNNIYECPSPCKKCNQCHLNRSSINLKYNSLCDESDDDNIIRKCKALRDRVVFSKEKCVFDKRKINDDIIRKKDNCLMFLNNKYNSYQDNDDIFFKINFEYFDKYKDKVKDIIIKDIFIDVFPIKFNVFYEDKDDLYLFIVPKKINVGLSKTVKINGIINFKSNDKPINFELKYVVNIFNKRKNFNTDFNKNPLEKQIELQEEESKISSKIGEKKLLPAMFDDYSNNYLGENRYYTCQKTNGYSTFNNIINLENGEFIKKKLIDKPSTWLKRVDIARPWPLTFNKIELDKFKESNRNNRYIQESDDEDKTNNTETKKKYELNNIFQKKKSLYNIKNV